MAKNFQDGKLYVCNVCGEEYVGTKRKWTCPICGTADSYEEADNGYDDSYSDDEDEDEDY